MMKADGYAKALRQLTKTWARWFTVTRPAATSARPAAKVPGVYGLLAGIGRARD